MPRSRARGLPASLEPRCALTGDEPSWIELGRQLARPAVAFSPLRERPHLLPARLSVLRRRAASGCSARWGPCLGPGRARRAAGAGRRPRGGRAFGPRAAVVAAAFAAFYPELVWYPAHYWSETVFLLLLWAAVERTLAADAAGSWRTAAAAGGSWASRRSRASWRSTWCRSPAVDGAAVAGARERRHADRPPVHRLAAAGALALAAVLDDRALDAPQRRRVPRLRPRLHDGRPEPVAGQHDAHAPADLRRARRVGGAVAQDRYCRRLAWETIAARQPAWVFEKLAEQMPEFWKAGSEVLDHLVGRDACGPLAPAGWSLVELVVVLPYLAVVALALVGLARLRSRRRPCCCCCWRRLQCRARRRLRDDALSPAGDAGALHAGGALLVGRATDLARAAAWAPRGAARRCWRSSRPRCSRPGLEELGHVAAADRDGDSPRPGCRRRSLGCSAPAAAAARARRGRARRRRRAVARGRTRLRADAEAVGRAMGAAVQSRYLGETAYATRSRATSTTSPPSTR